MRNKILKITMIFAALILSLPVIANADPVNDDLLMMYIDSYASYKNNEYSQIDEDNYQVTPVISDSRTLVPARFVAEAFDCEVLWDGEMQEVTITDIDHTIKCRINSTAITVDGEEILLDVPAQIINDRTMLPLRALAENLDRAVDYYNGLIVIGSESSVKTTMQQDIYTIIIVGMT